MRTPYYFQEDINYREALRSRVIHEAYILIGAIRAGQKLPSLDFERASRHLDCLDEERKHKWVNESQMAHLLAQRIMPIYTSKGPTQPIQPVPFAEFSYMG